MSKVKDYLRLNVFWLVVVLVCGVYMARGLVNVVETGKTVGEILADGALSALFGFLVSKLLSLQGLAKGEVNEQVSATQALHAKTVESVSHYIHDLDKWCDIQNREAVENARRKILAVAGLSYEDYVCGRYPLSVDGKLVMVEERGLPRNKKKAVRKARRLRLTPLTGGALTTDGVRIKDPYDFGDDKAHYERKRDLKQVLSKVACGLLFGYFGVQLIANWSVSNLIWTALQVVVFLIMGVIAYLQAYFFVVDVDRHRVIRKIDHLQKFRAWREQAETEGATPPSIAESVEEGKHEEK